MSKKDKDSKNPPVNEPVSPPVQEDEHVVQHLDRDPNDPRNAEPTPKLPSLNDEGQS